MFIIVKIIYFEGTKAFDKSKNYHSKSMLVVSFGKSSENDVIGVIQLINKGIKEIK